MMYVVDTVSYRLTAFFHIIIIIRIPGTVCLPDATKKFINPLRPNNDLSQTSPCNIKGLSVREVLRIENMITQMKFY